MTAEPSLPETLVPTNTIDELMSRDPTQLSSIDIDAIIAWHRVQRQKRANGEKPDRPKVDISNVMEALLNRAPDKPAEPAFKKRI